MRPVLPPTPGPARPGERLRCRICRTELTRDQEIRGQVCGAGACGRARAAQRIVEASRRTRAIRERARELGRSAGVPAPARLAVAVVPSNDRALAGPAQRRVGEFRDHLTRKITEAFLDRSANPPPRYPPSGLCERDENLITIACATCRGSCCAQGGTHAFVGAGTILRYLARNPGARPRAVLSDYLARIPKRSYRGSCVFHAQGGCALPREMRSSTCNHYLCPGLLEFQDELRRSEARSGLAVAVEGDRILRWGSIDEANAEPLPSEALPVQTREDGPCGGANSRLAAR